MDKIDDPLAKTADRIRETAKSTGPEIFYGWLTSS